MSGTGVPPPTRKANRFVIWMLIAIAVVIAVVLVAILVIIPSLTPSASISFSSVQTVPESDIGTVVSQGNFVTYPSNNTIWVGDGTTQLAVMAAPPGHDNEFVIDNLTNPTIHMVSGAHLTMALVNADHNVDHDMALETTGPPYSHTMNSHMMGAPGTMMLPPFGNNTYTVQYCHISDQTAGQQYWYVCRYPGHAQDGMYGRIVVH